MSTNAKRPNTVLRQQRLLRGWSQQRVVDELLAFYTENGEPLPGLNVETVSRWERGERVPKISYQEKLCKLYGMSATELGFLDDDEEDEEEMQRREALKKIGTTGTSIVVGLSAASLGVSQEIDAILARKLVRLQNWVIDGLEDGTHLRWQLYYTSNNALTDDGLRGQIERLEQLADDGGDQHRRICRILAQNYQLAGSLARDRFQYTKAMEYFQKSEQLDQDVQLPDLTATAVARQAVALLRKDPNRYLSKVLSLYSRATELAKHAESYTQAYVLSGYAEALARNENNDDCLRALDQAEDLLNRFPHVPLQEDFAYVRLTLQSIADSRGECYVFLGKPEKGLEYLQAAQQKLDQKMSRNNCRLLMQQSEAYLAADQPDACVQQALKGLEIARALESTSNIHWACEILAKLRASPRGQESIVQELAEAVQS